jgi:hypothetical protein
MKKPPRRKAKPSATNLSAPAISAEAGREYRDIAETAMATATADELRQLVLLFATYADGLQAQIVERNGLITRLIELGHNVDQLRRAHYQVITTASKMLGRALSLSHLTDCDLREDYLKASRDGLDEQASIGFPNIDWPDKSTYARLERAN